MIDKTLKQAYNKRKRKELQKMTRKELRNELKTVYVEKISDFFSGIGEEVLRTKEHEIAIPVVDREGNEDFIKITIAIPTGANKGTEPYDGYSVAEEYRMKTEEKERKAKEKAIAKAKKIERDKKYREKKEELKKQREETD